MRKISDLWKRYGIRVCIGVLFVIAFLLRFYRIGELPDILHADEAGMGYNAWCLANYGVDRYLNELPIYPENFGGGQSPLYTYCLVLLLKLFPKAEMTLELIRLPALVSSMLVVVCGSKMIQMLFQDDRIVLGGTALLTFCPYFILAGRFAWDCNMMLGCSVLAITLLIWYLRKPAWTSLLLCGAGFALILYSYAVSYIILVIFLITMALYMMYMKKISIGQTVVWACEIAVLSLPIILFFICILFQLPGFRFLGVHILPIAAERVEDVIRTPAEYWTNVWKCIKMTLTNDVNMWNAVEKYYTMYMLSIPFIVIGFVWAVIDLVKSFRSRCFAYSAIFTFYALAIIITTGWTGAELHHANAIFVCYLYFCVEGIIQTLRFVRRYRAAFASVLCVGYVIWTAAFLRYYYTMYSVATDMPYPFFLYVFFYPEQEAFDFVAEASKEKTVYVESGFEEYIYFYRPISPYEKGANRGKEFSRLLAYDGPVEWDSVYMVNKTNTDFVKRIQTSGKSYEMTEFRHYYIFTISSEGNEY